MGNACSPSIRMKVTSEELGMKAQYVEIYINNMKKYFDNILNDVDKSTFYWRGDAGDQHRNIYKCFHESLGPVLQRFTDQVDNLRKMAGVYAVVEDENMKTLNALPSNFLN